MVDLTQFMREQALVKKIGDAMKEKQGRWPGRGYFGMSGLGHECDRWQWMVFRWCIINHFDAATLARFEDGHRTEELMIHRLKQVPGIQLIEEDEHGDQIGFQDVHGHLRGHVDGMIIGLPEAPKSWHVLEAKAVNEKKFAELANLRRDLGEKNAIAAWDHTYWVQVQLYMRKAGVERSLHVVTTPGGRAWQTCRTNLNKKAADLQIERAERIITANQMPGKVQGHDNSPPCCWCPMKETCHAGKKMKIPRSCRSCMHSAPAESEGADEPLWFCAHPDHNTVIGRDQQIAGCENYEMHPDLEEISNE